MYNKKELAKTILQPNFVARSFKSVISSYIEFCKEEIEDLHFNQHKSYKTIFGILKKNDIVFLKIPYQSFSNWCNKNITRNNVEIVKFDTTDKIYNEAISEMLANKRFLNAYGFLQNKYLDYVFLPFKQKIIDYLKGDVLPIVIFEIIKNESNIISKYCSELQFYQYCSRLKSKF